MNMKKTMVGLAGVVMGVCACGAGNYADTVVYGTIRTAETENPVAEALAVKDGKFIYVGDRSGAAAFIKDIGKMQMKMQRDAAKMRQQAAKAQMKAAAKVRKK